MYKNYIVIKYYSRLRNSLILLFLKTLVLWYSLGSPLYAVEYETKCETTSHKINASRDSLATIYMMQNISYSVYQFKIGDTTYQYKEDGLMYDDKDNKTSAWSSILASDACPLVWSRSDDDVYQARAQSDGVLYVYNSSTHQLYSVVLPVLPYFGPPPIADQIRITEGEKVMGFAKLDQYRNFNYLIVQERNGNIQGVELKELWRKLQHYDAQGQSLQKSHHNTSAPLKQHVYDMPVLTSLTSNKLLTPLGDDKLLYLYNKKYRMATMVKLRNNFYIEEKKKEGWISKVVSVKNKNDLWFDSKNNCLYKILPPGKNKTRVAIKCTLPKENEEIQGIGVHASEPYIVVKSNADQPTAATYYVARLDDRHQIVPNKAITIQSIDIINRNIIATINKQNYFFPFGDNGDKSLAIKLDEWDSSKVLDIRFWDIVADGAEDDFCVIEGPSTDEQNKTQIVSMHCTLKEALVSLSEWGVTNLMMEFYLECEWIGDGPEYQPHCDFCYMYETTDGAVVYRQGFTKSSSCYSQEGYWYKRCRKPVEWVLERVNAHTVMPAYQLFSPATEDKKYDGWSGIGGRDQNYLIINMAQRLIFWFELSETWTLFSYAVQQDKLLLLIRIKSGSLIYMCWNDIRKQKERPDFRIKKVFYDRQEITDAAIQSINGQLQIYIQYSDNDNGILQPGYQFKIDDHTYNYKEDSTIHDEQGEEVAGWCSILVDRDNLFGLFPDPELETSYVVLCLYDSCGQALYLVKLPSVNRQKPSPLPIAERIYFTAARKEAIIGFAELNEVPYLITKDVNGNINGMRLSQLCAALIKRVSKLPRKSYSSTSSAIGPNEDKTSLLTALTHELKLSQFEEDLLYLSKDSTLFRLVGHRENFYIAQGAKGKIASKVSLEDGKEVWFDSEYNCLYSILHREENKPQEITKCISPQKNEEIQGMGMYDNNPYIVVKSNAHQSTKAPYYIANLDGEQQIIPNNTIIIKAIDVIDRHLIATIQEQNYFFPFGYDSREALPIVPYKQTANIQHNICFWQIPKNKNFYVIEIPSQEAEKQAQIVCIPAIVRTKILKALEGKVKSVMIKDDCTRTYNNEDSCNDEDTERNDTSDSEEETCNAKALLRYRYKFAYIYSQSNKLLLYEHLFMQSKKEKAWTAYPASTLEPVTLKVNTATSAYQLFKLEKEGYYCIINMDQKVVFTFNYADKPIVNYQIHKGKHLILLLRDEQHLYLEYLRDIASDPWWSKSSSIPLHNRQIAHTAIQSTNEHFELHVRYTDSDEAAIYPINSSWELDDPSKEKDDYLDDYIALKTITYPIGSSGELGKPVKVYLQKSFYYYPLLIANFFSPSIYVLFLGIIGIAIAVFTYQQGWLDTLKQHFPPLQK